MSEQYVHGNSDLVKAIGRRRVGELVDISREAIHIVQEQCGKEIALALQNLGHQVTGLVNETATEVTDGWGEEMGGEDTAGAAMAYLTATVAANLSISVLNAVDEAMYRAEVERL